jgi:peptide-methionine (S)-S-oxide reductase
VWGSLPDFPKSEAMDFLSLVVAFASMKAEEKSARATLGGGCFWCVEAVYQTVPGILSVTSGYAGGDAPNPTYEQVCTGRTGHAEVVQIEFDPNKISYEQIIDLFWKAHDPTTLNRQGPDTGTQYRSIILYENEAQKVAADKSKSAAQAQFKDPIVTEIVPLQAFYPAEQYHQDFYDHNPNYPYSRAIIRPKLEKFQKAN